MYKMVWQMDEYRLQESNGEIEPFRFDVGARVECSMGVDEWRKGTIVKQYYREPQWPMDRWMPYQVRLDGEDVEENYLFAPVDADVCIRAAAE